MRKCTGRTWLRLLRYNGMLLMQGICALALLLTAVAAMGDAPDPRQPAYDAVARAEALNAQGNWQEAARILRGVVSKHPYKWQSNGGPGAYQGLGYRLLGEILIRERPNSGEGYVCLGIDQGEKVPRGGGVRPDADGYQQAEQTFRQGLAVDPDNPTLQFAVGWAILRQDLASNSSQKKQETLRSALEFFEKAASLDPGLKEANLSAGYSNLHLAYMINRQGYQPESKPLLNESAFYLERVARGTDPGWSVHRDLAQIYDSIGQPERAAVNRLRMFVMQAQYGKGRVYFPRSERVAGGTAFMFPMFIRGTYNVPQALYVVDVDGRNLRAVWRGSFTRYLVSPDGKRALLWVLDDPWFDSPEPRRMAAVYLTSDRKRWFKDGMVALAPGAVADGRYRQSIKWSKDSRSVTLLVHSRPDRSDWRRETLKLP